MAILLRRARWILVFACGCAQVLGLSETETRDASIATEDAAIACNEALPCEDDGNFCNGIAECNAAGLCQSEPVVCSSAGDTACSENRCSESAEGCELQPKPLTISWQLFENGPTASPTGSGWLSEVTCGSNPQATSHPVPGCAADMKYSCQVTSEGNLRAVAFGNADCPGGQDPNPSCTPNQAPCCSEISQNGINDNERFQCCFEESDPCSENAASEYAIEWQMDDIPESGAASITCSGSKTVVTVSEACDGVGVTYRCQIDSEGALTARSIPIQSVAGCLGRVGSTVTVGCSTASRNPPNFLELNCCFAQ